MNVNLLVDNFGDIYFVHGTHKYVIMGQIYDEFWQDDRTESIKHLIRYVEGRKTKSKK